MVNGLLHVNGPSPCIDTVVDKQIRLFTDLGKYSVMLCCASVSHHIPHRTGLLWWQHLVDVNTHYRGGCRIFERGVQLSSTRKKGGSSFGPNVGAKGGQTPCPPLVPHLQ